MGSWQRIFHHRQMKMALFRMTNHLGSTAFGVEGSNGHFSIFEENCWSKFFTLLIRLLSLQLCSVMMCLGSVMWTWHSVQPFVGKRYHESDGGRGTV